MTRKCLIWLCSLSFLVAMNAAAQYSHIKNVINSDHDLSASSTTTGPHAAAGGESETCFFCHAPHQSLNTADTSVTTGPSTQAPLWNHYLSSVTTGVYGVYSSSSFNALSTDIADLGGAVAGSAAVSNLCLSCHDGTVGVNVLYHGQYGKGSPAMVNCGAVGNPAASTSAAVNTPCIAPDAVIIANASTATGTKSLASLHPINFTYNAALAGQTVDLVTPVAQGTYGGSTRLGVPGSGGGFLPLFETVAGSGDFKMQCATCHDVHNGTPNDRPFLRDTTTGSQLCLDCHGA